MDARHALAAILRDARVLRQAHIRSALLRMRPQFDDALEITECSVVLIEAFISDDA
jgi:hypothetical protein